MKGNSHKGNGQGVVHAIPLPIDAIAVGSVEKNGGDGDDEEDGRLFVVLVDEQTGFVDCWVWAIMREHWTWITYCVKT